MKIDEGNKLIAVFMGGTLDSSESKYYYFLSEGRYKMELKYDSDWNELMNVVSKIEKTWRGEDLFCVKIAFNTCIITQERLMDKPIVRAESTNRIDRTKIEAVWSAVVAFIEWYNKH